MLIQGTTRLKVVSDETTFQSSFIGLGKVIKKSEMLSIKKK
jgi:hypothetical protein